MKVLEIQPCEHECPGALDHSMYRVVDPAGNEDWLCAHDVEKVQKEE